MERCPACGDDVLIVDYDGREVQVEPHEHEPDLDGRFPSEGYRVREDGTAAVFKARHGRRGGEAVHLAHRCCE